MKLKNGYLGAAAIIALAAAVASVAQAAGMRDGLTINTTGSTNTSPYVIKVWSDGEAEAQVENGSPAVPFKIGPALVRKLFADAKAARAVNALGDTCMKSASFGTTTHLVYHGWSSPDLQCGMGSPQLQTLAADYRAVSALAPQTGSRMHRLPRVNEPRQQPAEGGGPPTPSVTPSP